MSARSAAARQGRSEPPSSADVRAPASVATTVALMVEQPSKVLQYCYFWIESEAVTAAEVTEALGLEPDKASVRGSRMTTPKPVPVSHSWEIHSDTPGDVDAQADQVLARMAPVAQSVQRLVERDDVDSGLMVVRYFNDPRGTEDSLGWMLTPAQVALVAAMGGGIQVDEYRG